MRTWCLSAIPWWIWCCREVFIIISNVCLCTIIIIMLHHCHLHRQCQHPYYYRNHLHRCVLLSLSCIIFVVIICVSICIIMIIMYKNHHFMFLCNILNFILSILKGQLICLIPLQYATAKSQSNINIFIIITLS